MKNGYDQFFKNARKAAAPGDSLASVPKGNRQSAKSQSKSSRQFPTSSVNFEFSEADIEQQLKERLGLPAKSRKKKRKSIPWKLMGVSFLGVIATAWGYQNLELVEKTLKNVEISYLGSAMAAEGKPAAGEAKKAEAKKPADAKGEEKKVDAGKASEDKASELKAAAAAPASGSLNDEAIDHLSKLNERKKELDEREEELNRVEQELAAQKEELEKRMKEIDGVRKGISSTLEEKVTVDEKKLDTLVLIYTDMKAPQAAKVFETMDEDLAVGILGRMKKKNAADIMTLLKADKAQALTEKFAGYKRK
jgi:flagellar motility protein MotE (MotC chaperone)